MVFCPCLSRKCKFNGLGARSRWPLPPACQGKGRLMDLVGACDGRCSLPVMEKAVSWTLCALAMGFPPLPLLLPLQLYILTILQTNKVQMARAQPCCVVASTVAPALRRPRRIVATAHGCCAKLRMANGFTQTCTLLATTSRMHTVAFSASGNTRTGSSTKSSRTTLRTSLGPQRSQTRGQP